MNWGGRWAHIAEILEIGQKQKLKNGLRKPTKKKGRKKSGWFIQLSIIGEINVYELKHFDGFDDMT